MCEWSDILDLMKALRIALNKVHLYLMDTCEWRTKLCTEHKGTEHIRNNNGRAETSHSVASHMIRRSGRMIAPSLGNKVAAIDNRIFPYLRTPFDE